MTKRIYTRLRMLDEVKSHGWSVKTCFDGTGPFLRIDPKLGGITLDVRVPVFLKDDHSIAMQRTYSAVGDLIGKHFWKGVA